MDIEVIRRCAWRSSGEMDMDVIRRDGHGGNQERWTWRSSGEMNMEVIRRDGHGGSQERWTWRSS